LNKHGVRRGDRIWNVWNVACDHSIEVLLRKMYAIIRPYNNKYNIIEDLEYFKPNCSAEFAYDWILKNQSKIRIDPVQDMTIRVNDGSGQHLFNVSAIMGGISNKTSELDDHAKMY